MLTVLNILTGVPGAVIMMVLPQREYRWPGVPCIGGVSFLSGAWPYDGSPARANNSA